MIQLLKHYARRVLGPDRKLMSKLPAKDRKLVERICYKKLTYLSRPKLVSVMETCRAIEEARTPGAFLEAGCALGGSSILISSVKRRDRPFRVYDVFGMIPPPTEEDNPGVHERYRTIVEGKSTGLGNDTYYGYQENLYEVVLNNLKSFDIDPKANSVTLIKGLLQETMEVTGPVAFAHVDVDWYDPVMTCLTRIVPHLSPGGSIILDDYHDWGGCRKATDEYMKGREGQFTLDDSAGSMKLTRLAL